MRKRIVCMLVYVLSASSNKNQVDIVEPDVNYLGFARISSHKADEDSSWCISSVWRAQLIPLCWFTCVIILGSWYYLLLSFYREITSEEILPASIGSCVGERLSFKPSGSRMQTMTQLIDTTLTNRHICRRRVEARKITPPFFSAQSWITQFSQQFMGLLSKESMKIPRFMHLLIPKYCGVRVPALHFFSMISHSHHCTRYRVWRSSVTKESSQSNCHDPFSDIYTLQYSRVPILTRFVIHMFRYSHAQVFPSTYRVKARVVRVSYSFELPRK